MRKQRWHCVHFCLRSDKRHGNKQGDTKRFVCLDKHHDDPRAYPAASSLCFCFLPFSYDARESHINGGTVTHPKFQIKLSLSEKEVVGKKKIRDRGIKPTKAEVLLKDEPASRVEEAVFVFTATTTFECCEDTEPGRCGCGISDDWLE